MSDPVAMAAEKFFSDIDTPYISDTYNFQIRSDLLFLQHNLRQLSSPNTEAARLRLREWLKYEETPAVSLEGPVDNHR